MAIETATKQYSKQEVLDLLDPVVAKWFASYRDLTPPQQFAVANIHAGRNTLIASPTGSGKTLSAFLSVISELVSLARKGKLDDRVYCVYISPLRSLNNDVQKNLSRPLEEIKQMVRNRKKGSRKLQDIRVSVRTGDTTPGERARMLHNPPHILITTPESLAILLVAPRFREHLRKIHWVVVDEIHELCNSKRGVHLSLSLERLQSICERPFARVGLSATIHPLSEVARFLVGYDELGRERECIIADTRFVKKMEVEVSSPVPDLVHTDYDSISSAMYARLSNTVKGNRTTLIFANTRSGTERIAHQLIARNIIKAEDIAAHHGSLSRDSRKEVEDKLKDGKMRAVITSTSLELGLDIGSIDLVFQIGSPKSIIRCLQRIGRSGHSIGLTSKGLLLAIDRDDLVEIATIACEMQRGSLDALYFPKAALDVLAQHVVGMSVEKRWKVKEAFELVRRSYVYHDIEMEAFRRVLRYLSGNYQGLDTYGVYGKIWYDESDDSFAKRGAMVRVIYCTNIGTIPDEVSVTVLTRDGTWVGQIDEEFLERISPGDVFVLGGKMYKFAYAKGMKAYVEQVQQGKPTIPVWFSEMLPLSFDLGEAISRFRGEIFSMIRDNKSQIEITEFISSEARCDQFAAEAIYNYIKAQTSFLEYSGAPEVPDAHTITIENYFDGESRQNLIFNCVFGRRVNDALARALAFMISEKRHGNLMVSVSDTGFMITLPAGVYFKPEIAISLLSSSSSTLRRSLANALRRSEVVKRRFRHCCGRALMILRNYRGRENSVGRRQVSSQILMSLCERLDRFPVLEEAYREVMEDLMDVRTAEQVVREVAEGKRKLVLCRKETIPSPFSHNLILRGSPDLISFSDRRETLQGLYDSVMKRVYASQRNKGSASGEDKVVQFA